MKDESTLLSQTERFNRLCKPLKDLALNWEVDIAEELSDYLEAIQNIPLNEKLNYAEVAMIIQGSANVYSKKVEFLHKLVYKSLDYLTNSSVSAQVSKFKNRRTKDKVNVLSQRINDFERLTDVIKRKKNAQVGSNTLEDTGKAINDVINESMQIGKNNLHILEFSSRKTGVFDIPGIEEDDFVNEIDRNRDFTYMPKIWKEAFNSQLDELGLSQENLMEDLEFVDKTSNRDNIGEELDFNDLSFDNEIDGDSINDDISELNEKENLNELDEIFNNLLSRDLNNQKKHILRSYKKNRMGNKSFEKKYKRYIKNQSFQQTEFSLLYNQGQAISSKGLEQLKEKLEKNYIFERNYLLPLYKDAIKIRRHYTYSQVSKNEREILNVDESDTESLILNIEENDDISESEDNEFNFNNQQNKEQEDEERKLRTELDLNEDEEMPQTYIDLVKLHVKKYLIRANKWAKTSNIEEIVKQWQTNLSPILAEQATHPEFDIHEYGKRILEKSTTKEKTISFDQVATSLSDKKYETCRIFLATLQLANNEKVELHHESNYSRLDIVVKEKQQNK